MLQTLSVYDVLGILYAFHLRLIKRQNAYFSFWWFCFVSLCSFFFVLFIRNFERFYIITFLVKYRKTKRSVKENKLGKRKNIFDKTSFSSSKINRSNRYCCSRKQIFILSSCFNNITSCNCFVKTIGHVRMKTESISHVSFGIWMTNYV